MIQYSQIRKGEVNADVRRFYGIIIRMYFLDADHNPPHIHAIYNEDAAEIEIATGKMIDGNLPPKALTLVREWVSLNRETLNRIWETQEFIKIEPLV